MHGLAFKAVELFVNETHGSTTWADIMSAAKFDFGQFETLLVYEQESGVRLLGAVEQVLDRPRADILVEIGKFLVRNPATEGLRCLLRFGGADPMEFLVSLSELPDRVRLAMPDFELPEIDLRSMGNANFQLVSRGDIPGFGHVLTGLVAAMLEDYGTDARIEHHAGDAGVETLGVTLLNSDIQHLPRARRA